MSFEAGHDGHARLVFVKAAYGVVGQGRRHRNWPVEIVRVVVPRAGMGMPACEAGSKLRVRMHDGTDLLELAIEQRVGVEIGGRAQSAFNDPAVEIRNHHMLRPQLVVVNA